MDTLWRLSHSLSLPTLVLAFFFSAAAESVFWNRALKQRLFSLERRGHGQAAARELPSGLPPAEWGADQSRGEETPAEQRTADPRQENCRQERREPRRWVARRRRASSLVDTRRRVRVRWGVARIGVQRKLPLVGGRLRFPAQSFPEVWQPEVARRDLKRVSEVLLKIWN